MIYRDDPPSGVAFLLKEAADPKNVSGSALLRQAASDARRWCGDKDRDKCDLLMNSD